MKLYTINYDFNTPTARQLTVPTNTQFRIGVKAIKNGVPFDIDPSEAALKIVGTSTTIPADDSKYNGYVTFQIDTADTPSNTKYGLDVDGDTFQDFALMVQVKKSDEGDTSDADGGLLEVDWDDIIGAPSNVGFFDNDVGYVTASAIPSNVSELNNDVNYVTASAMASALSDYPTTSTVASTYATKLELSAYATTSAMVSYVDAQIGDVLNTNF